MAVKKVMGHILNDARPLRGFLSHPAVLRHVIRASLSDLTPLCADEIVR